MFAWLTYSLHKPYGMIGNVHVLRAFLISIVLLIIVLLIKYIKRMASHIYFYYFHCFAIIYLLHLCGYDSCVWQLRLSNMSVTFNDFTYPVSFSAVSETLQVEKFDDYGYTFIAPRYITLQIKTINNVWFIWVVCISIQSITLFYL